MKNINNILPPEIIRHIIDFTGIYVKFSVQFALYGWTRFDFPLHTNPDKKIMELQLPKGVIILVRDYLQVFDLNKMYPHLRFQFEKQDEHKDMENLCDMVIWEKLVRTTSIEINGKTRQNTKLITNNIKTSDPVDSWVLPWVIGQCRFLKSFGITESTCIRWPRNIAKLKQLRIIYNYDNDYDNDLDDWVGELTRLEELSWQLGNKLSYNINKCKFLNTCIFYNINTTDIPDLSTLPFLELLTLDNIHTCNDGWIPSWIGECKHLKSLSIENGNITKIPYNLINLDLEYISLQGNRIEELPSWFSYIRANHINIANNEIEVIPNSFVQLDYCVNYVSLFGNPLRILPKNMEKLKKRIHFWIRNPVNGELCVNLCQQDINMLEGFPHNYAY